MELIIRRLHTKAQIGSFSRSFLLSETRGEEVYVSSDNHSCSGFRNTKHCSAWEGDLKGKKGKRRR